MGSIVNKAFKQKKKGCMVDPCMVKALVFEVGTPPATEIKMKYSTICLCLRLGCVNTRVAVALSNTEILLKNC